MNKVQRLALKTELQKVVYDNMDEQATIDALSVNSGEFAEELLNSTALLNRLDTTEAATILDKLEAASAVSPEVKWAMKAITTSGIDIGNTATRVTLDQLELGGVLTATEVTNLKALATPLTVYQSLKLPELTFGDITKAREA